MKKLYPGGKAKAFNITYDDGVLQDERFVALLNKYGIKGTFNLNSELMQNEFSWTHPNGMQVKRLSVEKVKHLYDGHEVASHTLTHPYMYNLSDGELYHQLKSDKENLEKLFEREIKGFAVPFDYYDDRIAECAKACGFAYARKSEFTNSFKPCSDSYHWKTGIYHIDDNLTNFVADFLNTEEELAVCQIVGHSYDLDAENLWGTMELICAAVSKCDDIWFCTNAELVEFLKQNQG
ncbi:MAG: polysaccharide deacetylase family protein [Erysipelotrichaceae bacterium]|nr:polysaccharide deacetylase family protein [Erysipelotrichaceae bacterium]